MSRAHLRHIRRDDMARDAEQWVIPRPLLPQGDRSVVRRAAGSVRDWLRGSLKDLNSKIDLAVAVRHYEETAALVRAKLALKATVDE